jgi:hypothetical protein
LGSGAKAVQNGLFVVVTGNAFLLAEHTAPLIGTLIVNAVKAFVQDRFND